MSKTKSSSRKSSKSAPVVVATEQGAQVQSTQPAPATDPVVVATTPAPAKARGGQVKPWMDLPATPALQKAPREKTTIAVALALTERPEGATLQELSEGLKAIQLEHHDPKALLVWMSGNRGWGFRMDQATQRIHLVRK